MTPTITSPVSKRSRKLVIHALETLRSATRAELLQSTGLSRATVTSAVTELLAEHALEEHFVDARGGRGRTPARLTLAVPRGLYCGIDLGNDHIGVALGRGLSSTVTRDWIAADVDGDPAAAVTAAIRTTESLISRIAGHERLRAIVVAVPQPVTGLTRNTIAAPVLKSWRDLDVANRVARHFQAPVIMENDANAGALAEVGPSQRSVIFVKVAAGVGAGLILNGGIIRGPAGQAGEIGHITVDPAGRACGCGRYGCLETVGSMTAILHTLAASRGPIDARGLDKLLEKGDHTSSLAIKRAGEAIGLALTPALVALQIDHIIVDAPTDRIAAALIPSIRSQIRRLTHPDVVRGLSVERGSHGRFAVLTGAYLLATSTADLA